MWSSSYNQQATSRSAECLLAAPTVPPLQDDEALLLYSVVRGLRFSSVLEIGGLRGYSAHNFLQAMEPTQGAREPGSRQCFHAVHAAHQRTCSWRPAAPVLNAMLAALLNIFARFSTSFLQASCTQ